MVWELFNIFVLSPINHLFIKEVKGRKNLPKPPFIITANHTSILDPFIIAKVVYNRFKRKTHYIADAGRFGKWIPKSIAGNWAGCILTYSSTNIFSSVKKVLSEGIVGLFPEGKYTPDGKVQRFRNGISRMAIECNVPVVPIALKGTYKICPAPKVIPKLKKEVEVIVGKPRKFSEEQFGIVAKTLENDVKRLLKVA